MATIKQCVICLETKSPSDFVVENGKRLDFCKQCEIDMQDFKEELGDDFVPVDELDLGELDLDERA